ncbi:hypothetical protein [uncultured Fibrella sp.]|uniref:hypothetical protein n=1 Tax=uncultured Fibrella sp. TaxID=1284596 RepID=UPI0035C9F879
MKGLPRITEIIKIEPFKITVRWTTSEIRVLDFNDLLTSWGVVRTDSSDLSRLFDYDTFKLVSVSESKTLQWALILVSHLAIDKNDNPIRVTSPLMLDPDVLYEASRSIEEYRLVPVAGDQLANAA